MADEIIEELWKVKDSIAREHGYDIERIVAHFRKKKRPTSQHVVDLSVRKGNAGRGDPADSSEFGGPDPCGA